jgi:hypothetical protein
VEGSLAVPAIRRIVHRLAGISTLSASPSHSSASRSTQSEPRLFECSLPAMSPSGLCLRRARRALGEDPPRAIAIRTSKASNTNSRGCALWPDRQVVQCALVAAVDAAGVLSAAREGGGWRAGGDDESDLSVVWDHVLDGQEVEMGWQAGGEQGRRPPYKGLSSEPNCTSLRPAVPISLTCRTEC